MTNKRELLTKLLTGELKPNEVKIPCHITPAWQMLYEGETLDPDKEFEYDLPDKGRVLVKWKDIDTKIAARYQDSVNGAFTCYKLIVSCASPRDDFFDE